MKLIKIPEDKYYDYYEIVGVEDVANDEPSISVQPVADGIIIQCSEYVNACIYTVSGMLVSSVELNRGRNFLSFSSGVYILRTKDGCSVKFLVY